MIRLFATRMIAFQQREVIWIERQILYNIFFQIYMELNCDWTDDFDKEEKFFDEFYKENVQNLQMFSYYVNKDKELFHIKKDILNIDDGVLKKGDLIYHLGKNRIYDKKKFQLLSMLKYNINIEPVDIQFFLNDPEINQFLNVQKHIDDIKWEDTITLFQDLNSIIFIYNEKVPSFNTTKKIRIGKKRRKTKRKYT